MRPPFPYFIAFQLLVLTTFYSRGAAYSQAPPKRSTKTGSDLFLPSDAPSWLWTKGTVFADGRHNVAFEPALSPLHGQKFSIEPSVQETLADGINLSPDEVHASYRRSGFARSWTAEVSRRWGTHGLPPEPPATRTETAEFRLVLENLRIEREGGDLVMTGLCSYDVNVFYNETGRDKSIRRRSEASVQVEFRAAAPVRQDAPEDRTDDDATTENSFLEKLRNECSDTSTVDSNADENSRSVTNTAISVNGKLITINVFTRGTAGAGVVMPYGDTTHATVFLPDTWIDNDRHAHAANEIANIIIDARDGDPSDGQATDESGRRISPLMAEALSDRMTSAWARHLLAPRDNPYPFEKWLPDDPKLRKKLFEVCAKDVSPTWFFPGDSLRAIDKEYSRYADVLERADSLVREGRYSEAVDFMEKNGRDYRCKVVGAADFHTQQAEAERPRN